MLLVLLVLLVLVLLVLLMLLLLLREILSLCLYCHLLVLQLKHTSPRPTTALRVVLHVLRRVLLFTLVRLLPLSQSALRVRLTQGRPAQVETGRSN
jgi:hypothetical protein